MTVPARPLPPLYYVDNFAAALRGLAARDGDLLESHETDFVRGYAARPRAQQALIVRMALRRGPFYRGDSLRYPEIPGPEPHLAALKDSGWLTNDPEIDVERLIAALPLTWLAEGFRLRISPALSKARMLLQAKEIYPEPLPLSRTHFRLRDGLYEFLHAKTCRHLCALYFGNHEQDWSEYAVTDLGIKRYERVFLDAGSRPFTSREQIRLFRALHHCEVLLETRSATEALAGLPGPTPTVDWLAERHRHVSLRVARQLEREGAEHAALEIYQRVESPEAAQRRGIVARRLSGGGERPPRFNHRAVPHFEMYLARNSTARVEYQVAEELARQAPESELIYAENRLFNSLFGLLFWPVIFAPVRGAFFHPFHAAPADLYSPLFCARRQPAIDALLGALDGPGYGDLMRETFRAKAGLLNPFVAWGWLRRPLLERALDCIPARDLRAMFEWMLSDLERNTTGFPDLLQVWPAQRLYRMVEVKAGADRLQTNQRRFLQYAERHGIPVSVCYLSRPAAVTSPRPPSAPRSRAGRSLELFPDLAPAS